MGLYEDVRKQLGATTGWTELLFTVVLEGDYRGVENDTEIDQSIEDNGDTWRAECEQAVLSGLATLAPMAATQSWGIRNPRIVSGRVESEASGSGGDPAASRTVGFIPVVLLVLSVEVLLGLGETRETYGDMIHDSIGSERWRAAKVV